MQPAAKSRLITVLRALAAVSVLASFASLWLSERTRVLDDLQLSVEATARPGETVALRAFYLRDVEAPAGPELARTDVRVRLLDAHDREVGRTVLHPSDGDPSMEGRLVLPASSHGSLTLEGRAELPDRTPIVCRRAIDLRPDAPTLVPRVREAAPLSLLSLGSLRPVVAEAVNEGIRLEPRVVGGACVPEQPCRLLIWMGARAALRVRHDAALELQSITPAGESEGFVELVLRVSGPEATIALEAVRAEQRIAERSLRLPVALGEARLSTAHSLAGGGQPFALEVALPPGREQGIVDLFAHGRWSASQAFLAKGGARALTLPAHWFPPGLMRVQAHADRFAGEGAGTRLVYLRAPGESDARALQEIRRHVRAAGFDTLPLGADGTLPPQLSAEQAATFLLAGLEGLRVPLPRSVSGRPPELARLSRAQAALRFGVGGMLTLSALVVGLTLMRRGFSAEAEARAILDEAESEVRASLPTPGEGEGAARGSREQPENDEENIPTRNSGPSRGVLVVVCFGLAVGLAFVLAALLIVAKPLWF